MNFTIVGDPKPLMGALRELKAALAKHPDIRPAVQKLIDRRNIVSVSQEQSTELGEVRITLHPSQALNRIISRATEE